MGDTLLSSNGFTNEYYDAAWAEIAKEVSVQEEARINETIVLIPEDCSSILDVGCGDGRITNRLVKKFNHVCGLDTSEEGLKHVESEKVLGNLDCLQFTDKSFDLILCCEVLEHLPYQIYEKALKEIERVSKKYIIISVPNNQDRNLSSVRCPYCNCSFDASRHVRSFDSRKLEGLFNDFKPIIIKPCVLSKSYPTEIYKITKFLEPIIKTPYPVIALCPQCGYSRLVIGKSRSGEPAATDGIFIKTLRHMARIIPKKRLGIWLIGVYERK
jgi:SAM-dependent methyltransferase